jgi:hypothetical protein
MLHLGGLRRSKSEPVSPWKGPEGGRLKLPQPVKIGHTGRANKAVPAGGIRRIGCSGDGRGIGDWRGDGQAFRGCVFRNAIKNGEPPRSCSRARAAGYDAVEGGRGAGPISTPADSQIVRSPSAH